MITARQKITYTWLMLKLTFGLVYVLAGLDKVMHTDFITVWAKYVSPTVSTNIPFPLNTFLLSVGILEIILGILILSKWTRLGAYLTSLWLVLIALNLLAFGLTVYLDIAIRDLGLAAGALALAWLTEAKDKIK